MKKFWTKEVKIGLTAIICIVLMFIVIQFLKGIDVTKPANYYTIAFDNVSDVMVSSPVTVNGYKVGVVHDMQYDYESNKQVLVMINLDKAEIIMDSTFENTLPMSVNFVKNNNKTYSI